MLQIVPLIFAGVGLLIKLSRFAWEVMSARADLAQSKSVFGWRSEPRELAYLRVLDKYAEVLGNQKSARFLKGKIADDVSWGVVRSYSRKQYRGLVGRADILSYACFVLFLLYGLFYILSEMSGKWEPTASLSSFLLCVSLLFGLLMLIPFGFLLFFMYVRWKQGELAARLRSAKGQPCIPYFSMCDFVKPGTRLIFLDATVRSGYGSRPMRQSRYVSSLMGVTNFKWDEVSLQSSETKQVGVQGYRKLIVSLVSAYLDVRNIDVENVTFFVFSECGITSVEVVSALSVFGCSAFNVGASCDNERLLNAYFTELNFSMACGLI